MSWTATASAWAGEVRTTAETVEQTAATVSAAMRTEDLLGNEIPPGTCVGAGTRAKYWSGEVLEWRSAVGAVSERPWSGLGVFDGDVSVTRVEAGVRTAARAFLRASISCLAAALVKVFRLNTSDRFMNRAAWAQIRLG